MICLCLAALPAGGVDDDDPVIVGGRRVVVNSQRPLIFVSRLLESRVAPSSSFVAVFFVSLCF